MNKKIYLIPFLLLAVLFASCEETKEAGRYDNWRALNDAFTDSLYNVYTTQPDRGGLDSIHLLTAPDKYIFYKKLTPAAPEGEEPVIKDEAPLFKDDVSVYYRGRYINGDIFDSNFKGDSPTFYFDSPSTFAVNAVVEGWTEILQRMKVGERRMVYVPWNFGYGVNDYAPSQSAQTIPGASTLIFDMQLVSIVPQKSK